MSPVIDQALNSNYLNPAAAFNGTKIKVSTSTDRIKNEFVDKLISSQEANELLISAGELGDDPSCKLVANRKKKIGFFLCLSGKWLQLNCDTFFASPADPNDNASSPRGPDTYCELPKAFVRCAATRKVLDHFKETHSIPDGVIILVQVQRTEISPTEPGKYLTGQPPHTDGAEKAMILCLERENVADARNVLMKDQNGAHVVMAPKIIQVGEAMLWNDNKLYHAIEPAKLNESGKPGSRTVLIAHYPAVQYITGEKNLNNELTRESLAGVGETHYECFGYGGFSTFMSVRDK